MKYLAALMFSLLACGCQSPPNTTASALPLGAPEAVAKATPDPDHDKPVDVWVVPVLGFPDEYTEDLLDRLHKDERLNIRKSMEAGISDALFFPDNKQMISEKALEAYSAILPSLGDSRPNTVYVFLTAHDLNNADRRFRFVFSQNNSQTKMAIISIARLRLNQDGPYEAPSITKLRLFKMVKRQIGELYHGYNRNTDPGSVMYSPLMGLDDLDMISTNY